MFQGKQLVIAAAFLAIVAIGAPQSAEASLVGVPITATLDVPGFSDTENVALVPNIFSEFLNPEFEVEEPSDVGTGLNQVDINEVFEPGDMPGLFDVATIAVRYLEDSSPAQTILFAAKTWTFSGVSWPSDPNAIIGSIVPRLTNPAGATANILGDDSFEIVLPELELEEGGNVIWRFDLFVRHEETPGVPEPGTLLLLGVGLLGLSRVRRRS